MTVLLVFYSRHIQVYQSCMCHFFISLQTVLTILVTQKQNHPEAVQTIFTPKGVSDPATGWLRADLSSVFQFGHMFSASHMTSTASTYSNKRKPVLGPSTQHMVFATGVFSRVNDRAFCYFEM